MITTTKDVTIDFNTDSLCNIEVSGWDYAIVQVESLTGTVNFNATLDGGAVTGTTNNSPALATAFQPVQGTNLATGTAAVSVGVGSFLYKFGVIGNYLQLAGTAVTASKVLVFLAKIS